MPPIATIPASEENVIAYMILEGDPQRLERLTAATDRYVLRRHPTY